MLGLALDEPTDDCSVFEVNKLKIYMQAGLTDQLEQFGGVQIDFIDEGPDRRGFTITTQNKPGGGGSDCSSGCSSSGCGDH